jgi:NAD(P)-dependent dehydrogenase (short-subunit alcohol dehydrogenase family)
MTAVSDADSVQKSVKQVVEDFGSIDVFVANAGMAISKPILEQTLPEFDKQMSVNGTSSPSRVPHRVPI